MSDAASSYHFHYAGSSNNDTNNDVSDNSHHSSALNGATYEQAQSQSSSRGAWRHRGSFRGSHASSGRHSSLRTGSSAMSPATYGGTARTYSDPHPHPRPPTSLSGNLLVSVRVDEEPEMELDRDDLRRLVTSAEAGELAAARSRFQPVGDGSTLVTTGSAAWQLDQATPRIVSGNPSDSYDLLHGRHAGPDWHEARTRDVAFSPLVRWTFFFGAGFLLSIGVLFLLQDVMVVKTASDWVEPHSSKTTSGGIGWTFGIDAPQPIAGAALDSLLEHHLADWASGTSRIPAAAGLDGFGSVALGEAVMFRDVPLFWGDDGAGGGAILESVFGQCLGLVQASRLGGAPAAEGEEGRDRLATIPVAGRTYLNVDLATPSGVARAGELELGTSGMADVAYSPLLHEVVAELFSATNQGRLFVLVRHPVERELARFRRLRTEEPTTGARPDPSGPERDMSYVQFAHSDYVANNWMTRTLARKSEGEELTAEDLRTAKEILRRKALIGLYGDIFGATRHYARHFGWDHARNGGALNKGTLKCFESAIAEGMRRDSNWNIGLAESETREGSTAWKKIMEKNLFDFELFAYSQQLYKFQVALS